MSKPAVEKAERILVLCVDRDDDLSRKTGLKTPILGRKGNLGAATDLALQDPEEADANAMFEAVRIYDHLRENPGAHEEYEIAVIGGSELGGVEADRKLVSELNGVLKTFPATSVILVTDGFADETLTPLVESRVPVTSVRRIVVKHSESIEETAALFSRYLRMLWENPRYSRIALGLPGLLILVTTVLWGLSMIFHFPLLWVGVAFLLILGSFFAIRGFGVDRATRRFFSWVRSYSPPPLERQITGFSTIAGTLLIGIGSYQAAANISINWLSIMEEVLGPDVIRPETLGKWLAVLPAIGGHFIQGSMDLIVIGVCVLLSGGAVRWFLGRDARFLRTLVIISVTIWLRQILYEASAILVNPKTPYGGLVAAIVAGVIWAAAASLTAFLAYKKYARFFREREGEAEEVKEA